MIYNKNNFIIASLCPGDYGRYYLDGVHVTPKYTEVTNGHYLMRVQAPVQAKEDLPEIENHKIIKEDVKPFTFPAKASMQVANSIPTNQRTLKQLEHTWITENSNEEEVEFITTDLEVKTPIKANKLEGKWANTQAVFDNGDEKEVILSTGFNVDYMLKICQLLKKMKLKGVKLEMYGEKEAMRLTGKTASEQEVKILLMPMVI